MKRVCEIKRGTARQASYGVFDDQRWPWTLVESHGEVHLSREAGEAAQQVGELPDDATPTQIHDALAVLEGARTVAEQEAWLRETYPDEFDAEGNWTG